MHPVWALLGFWLGGIGFTGGVARRGGLNHRLQSGKASGLQDWSGFDAPRPRVQREKTRQTPPGPVRPPQGPKATAAHREREIHDKKPVK